MSYYDRKCAANEPTQRDEEQQEREERLAALQTAAEKGATVVHLHLPAKGSAPELTICRAINPYTTEEERLWQRIVGSDSITPEHIAAFEAQTGKRFDHNYLY